MEATVNRTYDYGPERRLAFWFLVVAFAAIAVGGLIGLFQALEHAGINFYPIPILGSYYKLLTLHGVLNALTWMTFFISGFLMLTTARALSGPEHAPPVLDHWRVWIGGAVVLILIAYVPTLITIIQASAWDAPGLLIR